LAIVEKVLHRGNNMFETYTKVKNSHFRNITAHSNHLMSKVVLLIGDDAEILQPLAVKLAANGGDIALASSYLSDEAAEIIRERVEAFGGRFLLLDTSTTSEGEALVDNIREELG
jgi:hypothetical protein